MDYVLTLLELRYIFLIDFHFQVFKMIEMEGIRL